MVGRNLNKLRLKYYIEKDTLAEFLNITVKELEEVEDGNLLMDADTTEKAAVLFNKSGWELENIQRVKPSMELMFFPKTAKELYSIYKVNLLKLNKEREMFLCSKRRKTPNTPGNLGDEFLRYRAFGETPKEKEETTTKPVLIPNPKKKSYSIQGYKKESSPSSRQYVKAPVIDNDVDDTVAISPDYMDELEYEEPDALEEDIETHEALINEPIPSEEESQEELDNEYEELVIEDDSELETEDETELLEDEEELTQDEDVLEEDEPLFTDDEEVFVEEDEAVTDDEVDDSQDENLLDGDEEFVVEEWDDDTVAFDPLTDDPYLSEKSTTDSTEESHEEERTHTDEELMDALDLTEEDLKDSRYSVESPSENEEDNSLENEEKTPLDDEDVHPTEQEEVPNLELGEDSQEESGLEHEEDSDEDIQESSTSENEGESVEDEVKEIKKPKSKVLFENGMEDLKKIKKYDSSEELLKRLEDAINKSFKEKERDAEEGSSDVRLLTNSSIGLKKILKNEEEILKQIEIDLDDFRNEYY